MGESEFEKSWSTFAEKTNSLGFSEGTETQLSDLEHLKAIGAHSVLIDTAKKCSCAGPINIAPSQNNREFSPEWMFKNSLPIGKDGCGNYVLWMDASKINSPILFVCHDPSEVIVLASSAADLFGDLTQHFLKNDTKRSHGILDDYLSQWKPKTSDSRAILHKSSQDTDTFDFNLANVGDSVLLTHRGKHTIVKEGARPGILILATEKDSVLQQEKHRDLFWTIGLLGILIILFSIFYFVFQKTVLTSIGYGILALLCSLFLFLMGLDEFYLWQEKRRNKKTNLDKSN